MTCNTSNDDDDDDDRSGDEESPEQELPFECIEKCVKEVKQKQQQKKTLYSFPIPIDVVHSLCILPNYNSRKMLPRREREQLYLRPFFLSSSFVPNHLVNVHYARTVAGGRGVYPFLYEVKMKWSKLFKSTSMK